MKKSRLFLLTALALTCLTGCGRHNVNQEFVNEALSYYKKLRQNNHIAENEGLPSLCLSFNGDPIPDSVLDDFCFTVKKKFTETKGC